ncbi:hypothetical protein GH714_005163 [Hevea brasiliensis]|uniref:Subtilisin-like protease fibronectin type-III domain-containing protein n=1 Tax=Hevea brasiliensis TaxID=3981 RepID=A0A6A6MBC1_HEVBR|nr:hypothetical protein GH714_005163 [Hevea brasiliensis]
MLLYSYNHVVHGFSARLTQSQLSEVEKSLAHLATYQESFGKLFTTYSPKFFGLKHKDGLWPSASYGESVIIGVLDTGIWPESESFNNNGIPSVPQRWKGQCENGTAFSTSSCNRKLIGARSFSKGLMAAGRNISTEIDYDSPRDFYGHGTHTSSTAAGNHLVMMEAIIPYNGAPWITTVGAGTLDRSFAGTMTLENGLTVKGTSYFLESIYITDAPLYYGNDNGSKAICYYGALNKRALVKEYATGVTVPRVVTNVGDDTTVYKATLEIPPGMRITVEPSALSFTKKYQKQSFSVSLEVDKEAPAVAYGYLKWIDQHNHVASSPLVAVKF